MLANLTARTFGALKESARALIGAFSILAPADTSPESDLAKLFRLAARSDTVSPQVLELLRKMA